MGMMMKFMNARLKCGIKAVLLVLCLCGRAGAQVHFCDFWGTARIRGVNVQSGDVIRVFESNGQECDVHPIVMNGTYMVHVIGDNPSTSVDEGVWAGNPVLFKINNENAYITGGSDIFMNQGSLVCNIEVLDRFPTARPGGPYRGSEGRPVQFDGSRSAGARTYAWNFGDGRTATGEKPSHVYADEGSYTVTLVVASDGGMTDVVSTTAVISNTSPVLLKTGPYGGFVNVPVQFTGMATDSGAADILTFTWDFDGDGQFDDFTGPFPRRSYSAPGDYAVTVKVSDGDGGTAVDTIAVHVAAGTRVESIAYDFPGIGWYMISLPVAPLNLEVTTLFPDALGGMAFTWDASSGAYSAETKMEPGRGYWMAFGKPSLCTVTGMPVYSHGMYHYINGWHMIGSVIGGADFMNPNDNPDSSVISPAFGWDPVLESYIPSTTLNEKQGYWIAVLGACDLTVGVSGGGLAKTGTVDKEKWSRFSATFGSQPPAPPDMGLVMEKKSEKPAQYASFQNYPNPFNPETTIMYELPETVDVKVTVFDLCGKKIVELDSGKKQAGKYTVEWRAGQCPSGIYVIRLQAGGFLRIIKCVLVK
jgi:PKD repeat protein